MYEKTESQQWKYMTEDKMIELIKAQHSGVKIETRRYSWSTWSTKNDFGFNDDMQYRIAVEKPSINWDHVSPEFNWLARDKSGTCFFYKIKPTIANDCVWSTDNDQYTHVGPFASFTPGTCDWKESLIGRNDAV